MVIKLDITMKMEYDYLNQQYKRPTERKETFLKQLKFNGEQI